MSALPPDQPRRLQRPSARARLLRAGLVDTDRALRLLADPVLQAVVELEQAPSPQAPQPPQSQQDATALATLEGGDGGTGQEPSEALLEWVSQLSACADPDLALLSLTRLAEACRAVGQAPRLKEVLSAHGPGAERLSAHRSRLLAVLGASQALGDFLVSHPQALEELSLERAWDSSQAPSASEALQTAVRQALEQEGQGGPRRDSAVSALRQAYYHRLLALAADDLCAAQATEEVSRVWRRMTELADAALDAGLLVARACLGPEHQQVSLAVVAMGKAGAGELNYVSDVDVVYVVGPRGQEGQELDEARLVELGTALASELARVVSAPGGERALWPLDTALRPEGKDGALVRTLSSHTVYYDRWAQSWEFQALLKARACAGDRDLGAAYEQAIAPFVWSAAGRENFVADARAMRQRVEQDSCAPGEDLRVKLGPGGLRDVEFTVQLLQLVHGRSDPTLRVKGTLEALEALTAGGYVGRQDAAELAQCYRQLRVWEHRSQLHSLRRTHSLPARAHDLRRLARGCAQPTFAPEDLKGAFHATKRRVRALHQEIYYRPLLGAVADLSTEQMSLSPRAARERLAAFGYLDPEGAMRHLQALTEGVSRAAAIQRQLLPVMIGWLGEGPDPDAGLLGFRRLSEAAGRTHWYLGMLRDSPVAARRLARVLSTARWTSELLRELPEAIAWLDDDTELRPRPPGALLEEVGRVLRRRSLGAQGDAGLEQATAEAAHAVMGVRRRELVRAALADSLDGVDVRRTGRLLTDATDAVLDGVLAVATALVVAQREGAQALAQGRDATGAWPRALAEHAVVALGRLGGEEISYASDADVVFVHRARPGVDPDLAGAEAEAVARQVIRLLSQAQPHPLELDPGLRPEGKQGALSRSLEAYRDYYGSWSQVWERHALVRARFAAGSPGLGRDFIALVDSLRWSQEGLTPKELREIRRLKARMEAERLPRGVEPSRHLKLGPGGLSDVEWAVQVLQLAHAGQAEALRTPSTMRALEAAQDCGLLPADHCRRLQEAWRLAGRIRSALVLGTGQLAPGRADVLPAAAPQARVVAALLGEPDAQALADHYRRSARRARQVVERVLFSQEASYHPYQRPGPDRQAAGGDGARESSRLKGQAPGAGKSQTTLPAPRRRARPQGPYPWS